MEFYDIEVLKSNGEKCKLKEWEGKVLLIVNTATGCGFTPQYAALEKLYQMYHEKGLEILDFPCNQFGHQAPGSDEEIHEFCTMRYHTSFDQFKKILVNGEGEEALFSYLKEKAPEEYCKGFAHKTSMKAILKLNHTMQKENDIKWNFTKFLVDQKGNVVKRLSPIEDPMLLEPDIKSLLG